MPPLHQPQPSTVELDSGRCFCGSHDYTNRRVVNGFLGTKPVSDIVLFDCAECGATRQDCIDFDYRDDYHERDWAHTYHNDYEVAGIRLRAYNWPEGWKVLDVGSNNGAFIDRAREEGYHAEGVEPGAAHFNFKEPHTYEGFLHEQHLPTDFYNALTLHDVLEHVPEPLELLKEAARVVAPGGQVIVDVPAFFEEGGKKHWKKREHVWFFERVNIEDLFERAGIKLTRWDVPIKGKIVAYGEVKQRKRKSFIFPPGIGDIYWCLTKLEGLMKKLDIEAPVDAYIWASGRKFKGRRQRGGQYLQRSPLVKFCGYKPIPRHNRTVAIRGSGANVLQYDVAGCDYLYSVNGPISPRVGSGVRPRALHEILPDVPVDWHPPMWKSLEQREADIWAKEQFGKDYFAGYFMCLGFYKPWQTAEEVVNLVRYLCTRFNKQMVLLGAPWDEEQEIIQRLIQLPFVVNMVGKTTLPQATSIITQSAGCVGHASGLTILAAEQGGKVACLWGKEFKPRFWNTLMPPDADYRAFDIRQGINPRAIGDWVGW